MSRSALKSWIGLLLSLLFLGLASRDVEWPSVVQSWKEASPGLLLLGTAFLVASWLVAAVRWRVLLFAVKSLRVRDTFAYIAIGYLANTVLPLRLGDLARAALIGRKKNIGISRSLGSIAIERLMDVLILVALTLVLMPVLKIPSPIQKGLAGMTAVALIALAGLLAVSLNKAHLPRLAAKLGRVMPRRWATRILMLLGNFSSGADVFHRARGGLAVSGLSAGVWFFAGVGTLLWLKAFHLAVPWHAGFFVLVVVNLGSAIPSSPGYIGVYHFLAMLALSLWVPDRNATLAYAIGTHALNMLANVGFGSWFLVREGLSLKGLKTEADETGMASSGGPSQNEKPVDLP